MKNLVHQSKDLTDLARSTIRKGKIYSYLYMCDSDDDKISLLVDMIISLQNQLEELQLCYLELKRYNKQCVHNRF